MAPKILTMSMLVWALALTQVGVAAPATDAPGQGVRAMSTSPVSYIEEGERSRIDWSTGVLSVTGYGSPGDRGPASHRRDAADKAAKQDAKRALFEAVDNIRLDSNRRLKDYLLENEAHQAALLKILEGAEAGTLNRWPDGGSEFELRLRLVGPASLADLFTPEPAPTPDPTPTGAATASTPASAAPVVSATPAVVDLTQYSAVIVEASGLGAQAALRPNLIGADGKALVLPNVGAKYLRAGADMDVDAGLNPLVLKASGTKGALRADLMLSQPATRTLTRALADKRLSSNAILLIQF
jgi:hypothetical protein